MEKFTSKRNKEKVRLTLKAVEEASIEQAKLIEWDIIIIILIQFILLFLLL